MCTLNVVVVWMAHQFQMCEKPEVELISWLLKWLLFHHYLCCASVFVLLLVLDWAWVCQCKYSEFA